MRNAPTILTQAHPFKGWLALCLTAGAVWILVAPCVAQTGGSSEPEVLCRSCGIGEVAPAPQKLASLAPASMSASIMESEPQAAPQAAAPVTQNLRCLLIFANTTDWTFPAAKITAVENQMFYSAVNVHQALLANTYGAYGIQHGNGGSLPGTVTIQLGVPTASLSGLLTYRGADETLYLQKVAELGYDISTYDRVLMFAPQNYPNGDSFAQAGEEGRTYFGYSVHGTKLFYYLLHEMSHNFGLPHSGKGTNQYGDTSCPMGTTWTVLDKAPGYNAPMTCLKGFLDPFPGTVVTASADGSYDLQPLGSSPLTTPGVRIIRLQDGFTYISYRRNMLPYSYLPTAAHVDKVMVHHFNPSLQQSNTLLYSDLKAVLSTGGSYTVGRVVIRFDAYGANNEFATVSVDYPEGNSPPVANSQSLNAEVGTSLAVTLSGTDPDGNALSYQLTSLPQSGTIAGTAPNLTYTPDSNVGATQVSFGFRVSDGAAIANGTVQINVADNRPVVSITAILPNASEQGTVAGGWQVTRVGDTSQAINVFIQFSGSATLTDDYTLFPNRVIDLYMGPGVSSVVQYATPVDDALAEGPETIQVSIATSYAYAIGTGTATVTIADNDATTYGVTYVGNGHNSGSVPVDGNRYLSGSQVTVLGNTGGLARTGYVFTGWNLAADGSGSSYAPGATLAITSSLTLYAQWSNQFSSWIGNYDVGAQTGLGDDPDGDGVPNGLENFFGTDPSHFSQGVVAVGVNGNLFSFTHPQNATPAGDLAASYRWSKNLSQYHYGGQSDAEGTRVDFIIQPNTPHSGTTTVIAEITGTPAGGIFFDVGVSAN